MSDDLEDQLQDDVKRKNSTHPPQWEPDPEDTLIGTLEYVERNIPVKDYGTFDVAVIDSEDHGEEIAVWLSHTVLKDQWEKANPSPGDRVGIVYLGKREPEHGERSYHNYSVRVDENESEDDPEQSVRDGENLGRFNAEEVPF